MRRTVRNATIPGPIRGLCRRPFIPRAPLLIPNLTIRPAASSQRTGGTATALPRQGTKPAQSSSRGTVRKNRPPPLHNRAQSGYIGIMNLQDNIDPFLAPLPPEVSFKDSPLARVVAQLRFSEMKDIEGYDFIAPFKKAIQSAYPEYQQIQTQEIPKNRKIFTPFNPQLAWRFTDEEDQWHVSLTPTFFALDTTSYLNRENFLERLNVLVQAFYDHIKPAQLDRLGIRYVYRIFGEIVHDIKKLVRPEVYGIAGSVIYKHATHALFESILELQDSSVFVRWGLVPPHATVDPAILEPITENSWILDFDMSTVESIPFDVDDAITKTKSFAERTYALFHWAVTKDFWEYFRGDQLNQQRP
jgi:uncharacterized protein (TIGR04255 family)